MSTTITPECRSIWRRVILALAVVLAALAAVSARPAPAAAATSRIRVASYNICSQKCPDLPSFKSYRAGKIASLVELYDPDVLFIQEAGRSSVEAAALVKKLPNYRVLAGANARYIFIRKSTMTYKTVKGASMSRGTTTVRAASHSKVTYVPYALVRRIATTRVINVVNFHLTALDSSGSDNARLAETKQIWSKFAAREKAYPSIYAGDMNSLSRTPNNQDGCESDNYREKVATFLRAQGYEDAVWKAKTTSNSAARTYNPGTSDKRAFCNYFHLNHIFTDNRLTVSYFRVHTNTTNSDHNMIIADLYPAAA